VHQIRFRLGLRPRPLGELIQRSPMHPSWWEGACCPLPRTPFPVLDPLGLEPRPLVPRPRCSHAFFFPNLGMSVQTLLHAAVECLSRREVGPTLQHVCPCTITSILHVPTVAIFSKMFSCHFCPIPCTFGFPLIYYCVRIGLHRRIAKFLSAIMRH